MFYILPEDTEMEKFRQLQFHLWHKNPFFQMPFHITYPVKQHCQKYHYNLSEFESKCTRITFMCRYCDIKRTAQVQSRYIFSDTIDSCGYAINRSKLLSMYMEETKNGRNFTYFKLNPIDDDSFVGTTLTKTSLKDLANIRKAKSTLAVLQLEANLDEIMLSILLEDTKKFESTPAINWTTTKQQQLPLVGAAPSSNETFGILQMVSRSFNFITCDGNPALNLWIYLKPFKPLVWVCLLIAVPMSTTFIKTAEITSLRCDKDYKTSRFGSIILAITAFLLSTTVSTKELSKNLKLRNFFAVWLLASIVLSNGYKGFNFSQAAAPNKKVKLESFTRLTGFRLFTKYLYTLCGEPFNKSSSSIHLTCTDFGYKLYVGLFRSLGLKDVQKLFSMSKNRTNWNDGSFLQGYNFKLMQDKENAKLMFQVAPILTANFTTVENLIGNCIKTAFVGREQEIRRLVRNFRKNCNTNVYSGKKLFKVKSSIWYVQESAGSYLKSRMSYLEQSGVYGFWKKWVQKSEDRELSSCPVQAVHRISLWSNIVVIFVVLLGAHILACASFGIELVVSECF